MQLPISIMQMCPRSSKNSKQHPITVLATSNLRLDLNMGVVKQSNCYQGLGRGRGEGGPCAETVYF